MEATLEDLGCEVVGPFGRIDQALAAVQATAVDAAVLDVNVRGEMVFPVAEALKARGVPMVFCTGYADLQTISGAAAGADAPQQAVRRRKP